MFQRLAARAVPAVNATRTIASPRRAPFSPPASIHRWATAKAATKNGKASRCGCRSAWKNVKKGNSLIVLYCSGPITREAWK